MDIQVHDYLNAMGWDTETGIPSKRHARTIGSRLRRRRSAPSLGRLESGTLFTDLLNGTLSATSNSGRECLEMAMIYRVKHDRSDG